MRKWILPSQSPYLSELMLWHIGCGGLNGGSERKRERKEEVRKRRDWDRESVLYIDRELVLRFDFKIT